MLGVIADHARDLLLQVRDDTLTLNAAYEQAVLEVRAGLGLLPEPVVFSNGSTAEGLGSSHLFPTFFPHSRTGGSAR